MTKSERQQLGKGLAFLSPWLIGFLAFTLIPVILSFYYSLCEYSLLQPPMFIGAENYRELARDGVFWQSLGNTLYFAAMIIPASLFLSLGLAMLLNVKIPGQSFFRTIIFMPSLVPIVASAMVWMWMLNGKYGMINYLINPILGKVSPRINWALDWTLNPLIRCFGVLLKWLFSFLNWAFDWTINPLTHYIGAAIRWVFSWMWDSQFSIPSLHLFHGWQFLSEPIHLITSGPSWLENPYWAMPALVMMSLWGVGYNVVVYLAGLQDVPRELYEAAEIDGAGIWGRLWHVTIPILSPVIFFNLIMSIIWVLQVLDIPYIMTPNGGPARSTEFIAMYLYDNGFRFLRMGYASAIAWIMLLVILALTGIAFWSSKRWVHYQGK